MLIMVDFLFRYHKNTQYSSCKVCQGEKKRLLRTESIVTLGSKTGTMATIIILICVTFRVSMYVFKPSSIVSRNLKKKNVCGTDWPLTASKKCNSFHQTV